MNHLNQLENLLLKFHSNLKGISLFKLLPYLPGPNELIEGAMHHQWFVFIVLLFNFLIIQTTVKWGNFGRWDNFGQYKTFILSNIFCHLKNNLVVNMEVKGYLQSVICFKRSFIRLDPMMS